MNNNDFFEQVITAVPANFFVVEEDLVGMTLGEVLLDLPPLRAVVRWTAMGLAALSLSVLAPNADATELRVNARVVCDSARDGYPSPRASVARMEGARIARAVFRELTNEPADFVDPDYDL